MRGPSLQKATIISFAVHLTFFSLTFILLRQSHQVILPSAYTVSLVSPEVIQSIGKGSAPEIIQQKENAVSVKQAVPQKTKSKKIGDIKRVEDKISAIASKKKIEKLVKLRSMIDLRARGNASKSKTKASVASRGTGTLFDQYYSAITKEIWQQWIYPPSIGEKDLEAVIAIKILKDGTTIVQKVEKSSGNSLFDRSALKALTKASPLPPPPYEMEIGVRFSP
jgi:colicin import membrane protein